MNGNLPLKVPITLSQLPSFWPGNKHWSSQVATEGTVRLEARERINRESFQQWTISFIFQVRNVKVIVVVYAERECTAVVNNHWAQLRFFPTVCLQVV